MPELVNPPMVLILWAVIGYALGTIPTGTILARTMNLGDLRQIGSGNIGATNVLRTGNKTAAFLTLLIDAGKGALAVLLARYFAGEDAAQIAALAAFLGHCFPLWSGFRGGKGVATYIGLMLALNWQIGAIICGVWLITALLTRYSSLAALLAAGIAPLASAVVPGAQVFVLGVVLALLIYARHAQNIARLRAGTETKIGAK